MCGAVASRWLDDLVLANGNIVMLWEVAALLFLYRNHGAALFFKGSDVG